MDELDDIPELDDPVMVLAFEGWNDAADAASSALSHLIDGFDAAVLAELDGEEFYDYQITRPQVGDGFTDPLQITWPSTIVYTARPGNWDRDLVLVAGAEPNLRWPTFASVLLGLADLLGVQRLYILGAMLADVPHTRPTPVTGAAVPRDLAVSLNLEPADYTGPAGINAVLAAESVDREIETLMLWAAVPHYLAEPPCPKATLALLTRLEDSIGLPIEHAGLDEGAEAWQRGAEAAVADDSQVAEYVRALEEQSDIDRFPGATADDIARDFERYLRRRERDS